MILTLPPTTNALYRVVNGYPILSKPARDWKRQALWALKVQPLVCTDKPVAVTARFYLKYDRDVDNLKLLLDVLKGVAYKDDKQVVELHVYKRKDKEPRVEISITVL